VEQASRYEHLRKDPDALFSIISKLESDLERLQVHLLNSNRKTFVAKSERQISSQELLIGFGEKPVTTKEEEVETLTIPKHKRIYYQALGFSSLAEKIGLEANSSGRPLAEVAKEILSFGGHLAPYYYPACQFPRKAR